MCKNCNSKTYQGKLNGTYIIPNAYIPTEKKVRFILIDPNDWWQIPYGEVDENGNITFY